MSQEEPEAPSDIARAASLAKAAPTNPLSAYLGFIIADTKFALPLASIREILRPSPITLVPRARPHISGILSVRGRITTIFDLREALGLTGTPNGSSGRILLIDGGEEVIGLQVDEVLQVYRLSDDEVELSSDVAGDVSDYISGIGRPKGGHPDRSGQVLILLEPRPLLRR